MEVLSRNRELRSFGAYKRPYNSAELPHNIVFRTPRTKYICTALRRTPINQFPEPVH